MKRSLEVADIFRAFGPAYREAHEMPLRHFRAMRAIEICRTAELGGHLDQCDHCGTVRISYNSCRNRHCPKCQCLEKERWLEAREKDLLPTSYFHVVFTLPEGLRPLALRNQKVIYTLLFKAVSETLTKLARDSKHLGAEIGFMAILHTWSQTLIDHPHLHCLVTGGGLSLDGKRWVCSKKDFFIPVHVLSSLFRGKFLDGLKREYEAGELRFPGQIEELKEASSFKRLLTNLYRQEWVVYCKPPLKNPERDSADHNKIKLLTLETFEFIRRFLLHVLPDQFVKIRYYGIMSHRSRKTKLSRCKTLLGVAASEETEEVPKETWQDLLTRITGIDPTICPHCGKGRMIQREILLPQHNGRPP